jgi:hypothetical protein
MHMAKGHTLKCPKCGHSTYIFYMTEEQAQKIMSGEIAKKVRSKSKNANFFAVIEETAELANKLKKKK